jgi:mono/diheme cytochrome c family protein
LTRKHLVLSFLVLFPFCLSTATDVTADTNEGEAIYKARCKVCHGEDGVPKSFAKGSPAFNDQAWKEATSVEAMEKVIAEGRKRMPAFRNKLTPEEIKAVSAYLKTL